jgi:glutaredoxin
MDIEVIGKADCHLCAQAESVVSRVCEEFGVGYQVRSIDTDPNLADLYWEKIPVLLIDGQVFDFWRVNEDRLRAKLGDLQG